MSVLKMYFSADDSLVSESPSTVNPVEFTLRADQEEVGSPVRLYAKCDSGYQATVCTVEPTGTSSNKWELNDSEGESAPTEGWEDPGVSISLGTVTTSPRYFWVRAFASDDEEINTDTSVTLDLEGVGEEV